MHELIDELRRRNEPVPVPLKLPDEDDLLAVEEQLYLGLPGEYREFLLCVSDIVLGGLEPATAADPHSHTYLPDVAANAWDRGLSRELIPICQSREGYYAIDQGGKVLLWQEGDFADDEWETIWYWVRNVWLRS